MKRILTMLLIGLLAVSLAACGGEDPEASSAVSSMIELMAERDFEKASQLIHPDGMDSDTDFYDDWGTMCTYLDGHEIKTLKWEEYTIIGDQNSDDFEETGILRAIMKDDVTFEVTYTYVVGNGASGFVDFHLDFSD